MTREEYLVKYNKRMKSLLADADYRPHGIKEASYPIEDSVGDGGYWLGAHSREDEDRLQELELESFCPER